MQYPLDATLCFMDAHIVIYTNQSVLLSIPLTLEYDRYPTMFKPYSYIPLDGGQWTNTPNNYLISLKSTRQLRLRILPKDTNTLGSAGHELTVH